MTRAVASAGWLDRLRDAFLSARGRWRSAMAFLAGASTVLAMAPFHVWPVLFLTMPALVWLTDAAGAACASGGREDAALASRRRWRAAFSTGWWFGFGYFLLGLFWIGEAFLVEAEKYAFLIPFAVSLLPAGLALFFGAALAAARTVWPSGFARVLVLAIALSIAEWLRGNILTGLPWNTLGYALTYPLALMQSAAVVGTYGLTPWVVLVGAAPLVLAADRAPGAARRRAWNVGAFLALGPLALSAAYGAARLAAAPAPKVEGVRLRIVQPSVPQRDKWRPEKQGEIFNLHLDLSRRDASGTDDSLAGITHVVWPEAAMPFLPLEHPEALAEISKLLAKDTHLLAGALRLPNPLLQKADDEDLRLRRVYNSLLVFGPGGGLEGHYDKNHLVPFGEYLPMPDVWRRFGLRGLVEMRGALTAGRSPRPLLDVSGLPKVGALICYEAIFPGNVIQGPERPGLLLSVTNDGWFGNTTGPRQHYHQARVRAVEEGLPLVRSANNGISAMFDAEGRVLARLDLDVRGVIDTDLPTARSPTPYSRLGDLALVLTLAAFAIAASYLMRRASHARRSGVDDMSQF